MNGSVQRGDRVVHDTNGAGVVTVVSPTGAYVVVRYESGTLRTHATTDVTRADA